MKKLYLCMTAAAGLCIGARADVPFHTGEVFGKAVKVAEGSAGSGRCVNVAGDLLYVGGKETLGVYSLSGDPLRPKLLGEAKDIASARQIALQDGMAYVTARANGIWIVDCRNPAKPFVAGHYPSTANCTGIDVAGDVCFVGGSKSGLEFIDVSRPQRPQLIQCVKKEPVESQSVAYRDGLLFSGEWGGKCVTIWDARDMKSLKRLACCALESNGDGVWVDGKWLYASTGFSKADKSPGAKAHPGQMGLEIYDVANPCAPKKVSRVDFEYCKPCTYDMWLVRVAGGMAFCTATAGGLYAVDVSDKSAPKVVDRWMPDNRHQVTSVAAGDGAVYVTVVNAGTWAIAAKGAQRLAVVRGQPPVNASFRTPRPEAPKGFHRWLPSDTSLSANVTGLAVTGDVCYAAAGTAGLFELELSDSGIAEKRRIPLAECMDVALAGDRLFVAAGREGWIVFKRAQAGELKEIARVPSAVARDVYAYGDGTRWAAFNTTVYDISDLAKPKPLANMVNQSRYNKFLSPDLIGGRARSPSAPHQVWVAGNSALKFFSWLDAVAASCDPPAKPRKMEGYVSRMGGMCAFGEKAFMADNGGWAIVEPGGKDVPQIRPFPGKKRMVGLPRWNGGKLVAVSGGDRTASIWDFSDVENPRLVRWFALPCATDAASFWRDTLVIPARLQGVLIGK